MTAIRRHDLKAGPEGWDCLKNGTVLEKPNHAHSVFPFRFRLTHCPSQGVGILILVMQKRMRLFVPFLLLGLGWGWSQQVKTLADLPAETQKRVQNAPQPFDFPNSNVVTLYESEQYELRDDGRIVYRYYTLDKILTDSGRDVAEQSLSYSGHYDRLTIQTARTILPDGMVVSVKPSDVRDTPAYTGMAMYEDTRQKEFVLPQVKEGAVVEIQYELVSTPRMPRFFHDRFILETWYPCLDALAEVTVGKGWMIRSRTKNTDQKPEIETLPDGRTRYRLQYQCRKEMKPEPAMPPEDKIFGWWEIATATDWRSIDQWWQSLAKGRDVLPAEAKKVTDNIKKKYSDPTARLRAVYYWVQRNIRYVAIELGESGYQPHSAAQICKTKYGDCKDMATLLVGMLKAVGVQANWVLIGIGSQEYPPDEGWAGPYSFDHCIARAQVGEKVYWLDATAGRLGLGEVPSSLRGCKGLVIGKSGQFEKLPGFSMQKPLMEVQFRTQIRQDGSARMKIQMKMFEDGAVGARSNFENIGPIELRRVKEAIVKQFAPSGKTIQFAYSDPRNWNQPFTLNIELELQDYVYKVGNLLLISLDPTQTIQGAGNSRFSDPKREFPIYSSEGPALRVYYEVELPEGYEVLAMPKELIQMGDLYEIKGQERVNGRQVTIEVTIKPKATWLPKEEYSAFRQRMLKLQKNSRQVIVLKKKET